MKKRAKAVALFLAGMLSSIAAIGLGLALFTDNNAALGSAILAAIFGCIIAWGCGNV